jgi:hypothetical protein
MAYPRTVNRPRTKPTGDLGLLAKQCIPVLGAELTAYLAGADSLGQFERWLDGGERPSMELVAVRLAASAEVIRIFAAENSLSVARHWLREIGDYIEAPARTVRSAGFDDDTIKDVIQAATFWVNGRRFAAA